VAVPITAGWGLVTSQQGKAAPGLQRLLTVVALRACLPALPPHLILTLLPGPASHRWPATAAPVFRHLIAAPSPPPVFHAPQADVARVSGVLPELLSQMRASVLTALSNDTSSISALRCLKLYLERISGSLSPAAGKVHKGPHGRAHSTRGCGGKQHLTLSALSVLCAVCCVLCAEVPCVLCAEVPCVLC
jgi:hypothetical protein